MQSSLDDRYINYSTNRRQLQTQAWADLQWQEEKIFLNTSNDPLYTKFFLTSGVKSYFQQTNMPFQYIKKTPQYHKALSSRKQKVFLSWKHLCIQLQDNSQWTVASARKRNVVRWTKAQLHHMSPFCRRNGISQWMLCSNLITHGQEQQKQTEGLDWFCIKPNEIKTERRSNCFLCRPTWHTRREEGLFR